MRITAAAAALFHLTSFHEGSPFIRAASNLGELPWKALLEDVTRHGKTIERSFKHRSGRWYSLRMKPFGELQKTISGVLVVLFDENTVRRALLANRGALSESRATLHSDGCVAAIPILAVDSAGRIIWANKAPSEMFGYDAHDLIGRSLEVLVPESFRTRFMQSFKKFLVEGKSGTMSVGSELQCRLKDGTLFPAEILLGFTKAASEKLAVVFVSDITERKKLEREIRQHESELAVLFDSSPDGLLRFDSNLRVTHANAAFGKAAGISTEALVGRRADALPLPRVSVQVANRLIKSVFQNGQPQRCELSVSAPEGVRQYEVRYAPELSPDGTVGAVIAVGRDITERKAMEQALGQREHDLATLFDNSPDVIMRLDRHLRNLYANAAWEKVTGVSRETALGKTSEELGMPPDAIKLQKRAIRQLFKTRSPVTVEFTYPSPAGPVEHEVRHIPEFDDHGLSSILLIGRDITEQKRLQSQAGAYERDIRALSANLMTAQEQERRRVARELHDSLCQSLAALAVEIGGVAAGFPASSPERQRLGHAREYALRTAEEARIIAHQLHPAILEDLGLKKALETLFQEFTHREGIQVTLRVYGAFSQVPREAASCTYRIAQEALNNIARMHAKANHVSVVLDGRRALHLSIRDDGLGFDPLAVRGAGRLGMISMGRTGAHGRWQPPDRSATRSRHSNRSGLTLARRCLMSRARILLADDHSVVRQGCISILEGSYEIVGVVSDGPSLVEAALRFTPDLIVLDISMPELNGLEAARRIKAILPEVKLLFFTMHPERPYLQAAFEIGAAGYVLKSSEPNELLAAVKMALDGQLYVPQSLPVELRNSKNPGQLAKSLALTAREREVLQLIAEGGSGKEIANTLRISVKTVL